MARKKLLFIGDAACGSGFGRATHHILKHMSESWEIAVIGVNYRGDPHDEPYPIYPAFAGGDQIGIRRVKEIVGKFHPNMVVVQSNPWNMPHYAERLEGSNLPLVGIVAVEGKNCKGTDLNGLTRAIFWNEFSQREAVRGGMTVPSGIAPLGVDTDFYCAGGTETKAELRKSFGLHAATQDGFLVLNVNRNQHRKHLDLSVQYFAHWVREYKVTDAYLMFHALPGSTRSCDLDQISSYYGVTEQVILSQPKDIFMGAPEESLRQIYRAADVGLTTTLGEGWGLTTMEMMACGVPVIAGDFSGLGEWARYGICLVPCPHEVVMPDVNNMIGGIPDAEATIEALDKFYCSPERRDDYARMGLDVVSQPQYRWPAIAAQFAQEIEKAL